MTLPFSVEEFKARIKTVQNRMEERDVDVLMVSDPGNIYWLTGIENWTFYVPQFVLILLDKDEPVWIGREIDTSGAKRSGWFSADNVYSYPENLIQKDGVHPSIAIGSLMKDFGFGSARIGYESDSYYFSVMSFDFLKKELSDATFIDCNLLVNWARTVKSEAELTYLRQASRIVEKAMNVAYEMIRPGVRQCDVVAEIYKTQIAPGPEYGGDLTAVCPLILAGENTSTAHPIWNDQPFENNQTIAIELGGARRRYTSALARTMHLGHNPPEKLIDTSKAVEEGLEAIIAFLKAGVTGDEVYEIWNTILARYNLTKNSRIGYAQGIGFPPDWGEHTISLRKGEDRPIDADCCIHIMIGMWMDGWGMEMSETVRVCKTNIECLTNFPREINVIRT
ncbi:MAG: Xaa-Pro peptidase family protein [Emcibacteraceae bacterium]